MVNSNEMIITDKDLKELINKASKITGFTYAEDNNSKYTLEGLLNAFEDLINECEYLKDEIGDIEQDRDDNYKPISKAEEIGYNESDFI